MVNIVGKREHAVTSIFLLPTMFSKAVSVGSFKTGNCSMKGELFSGQQNYELVFVDTVNAAY